MERNGITITTTTTALVAPPPAHIEHPSLDDSERVPACVAKCVRSREASARGSDGESEREGEGRTGERADLGDAAVGASRAELRVRLGDAAVGASRAELGVGDHVERRVGLVAGRWKESLRKLREREEGMERASSRYL